MPKAKRKIRKACKELARQIERTYYDDYVDETQPLDKSYFNGWIDGAQFALNLLDKKAVPLLPSVIETPAYSLQREDDNDGELFTTPEVIEHDCV